LVRYARATAVHLAVAVALGIATAVLVLAQAELLARGIARVVEEGAGVDGVRGVLLGLGAVVMLRALVAWFQDGAAQRAAAAVKSQLRRQVVARAAALGARPDAAQRRAEVATLATRGMDALDGYFGRYLPQLVLAVVVPLVVLARLVTVDLTATLTIALTLPLIPVFMVLVGLATEASTRRRWRALNRLGHHVLDVLVGLPTLALFGRARAQADAVRESTDRYRRTTMGTLRIAFLSSLVLELLATLSVALVAVGVGLRLVHGSLDLQTGLLVIILAPEAYLPLRQVGTQYHAAAEGIAAADAAFELLELEVPAGGDRTDVPGIDGHLRVEVVTLTVAYPDRPVATPSGLSFSVRSGELVVLTGPSGAGKSTVLGALLGFVAPTEGAVLLGDDRAPAETVPLAALDPVAWRRHVAWVDQRPYLFAGTVADNVRLAEPTADDERVRVAMDAAGLVAMDASRVVGEHGDGLSAGERRRVALARALLRPTAFLLLDEPTAGLDEATEADVLVAVRRAARDRAVVMVSHRPAAIAAADRVVSVSDPVLVPGSGSA
jgi:thiol reductant ABC exporter CydD subunit